MLGKQVSGRSNHLIVRKRAGQEANPIAGIIGLSFTGDAQHQNRHIGQACMQLSHKCRPADALHVFSGDNESQIPGKLRLLYEAESF